MPISNSVKALIQSQLCDLQNNIVSSIGTVVNLPVYILKHI